MRGWRRSMVECDRRSMDILLLGSQSVSESRYFPNVHRIQTTMTFHSDIMTSQSCTKKRGQKREKKYKRSGELILLMTWDRTWFLAGLLVLEVEEQTPSSRGKNLSFFGFLEYRKNEIHLVKKKKKLIMRQPLIWNEDYGSEARVAAMISNSKSKPLKASFPS